ncbi:MAG: hypothetical protein E1N59_1895 [Puniceicoccaceae bacterium 5H]|nr:MAG: hypothetical protein E1N59_1895 [Puniceicoccaceae bacterium 5H]
MDALTPSPQVTAHLIRPQGNFPGNKRLPLLHYKALFNEEGEPVADAIEERVGHHHWGNCWRWGVYDFHHYHSRAHEALVCYQGSARVQFGGPEGPVVEFKAGDAVVIPAGVAHCLLEGSGEFQVVGCYPPGQKQDMKRGSPDDLEEAEQNIPKVPDPDTDPLYGTHGPLLQYWQPRKSEGPES